MTDSIDQLSEDYFAAYLAASPVEAHLLGFTEYAGRVEPGTRATEDARSAELRAFVERARALPEDQLDDGDRLTREVLVADAVSTADVIDRHLREFAADPIFGEQASLALYFGMLAVPDADVAARMADTLAGFGTVFEALAERHREGLAAGRVPARFAVEDTIAQLDEALAQPVADEPAIAAIQVPDGVGADALRASYEQAVRDHLRPGMTAYRDVLRDEILAQARPDDQVGLCHVPGGDEAYAALLRLFTTTDKSAEEIHRIGLEQVAKLGDEYRALGPEVVGTDDLDQILEAMRSDPKLHFERGEQLVEASEVALQRAWDAMPGWFEVLPKARCTVTGTETGAKAFYFPPATDGSRGGSFFINVADPTSWGTFEIESMAFHEGIPGHHLQLAIASELTGVPEFRKHLHNSAYAEGWGLYTERLSDEMGLYTAAVDRMGMYSADSMRACRLVVDTGIHALGWTRQQAVDYMLANSPLAEGVVRPEVDRYIVSPGQATSYMIGRLEIQRMRAEAEQRLGEAFDVKRFHSAVLDSGSLPLGVLDTVVRARLS